MSIHQGSARVDALVLYKTHAARVRTIDDKIELEVEGGQVKRVRPKDILLLHPGPLRQLADLNAGGGNAQEAWELLDGETTTLSELAELVHGEFSPATAWATWQLVQEGLLFTGTPEAITPCSAEVIAREREERAAKESAERDWADFLARVERRALVAGDAERLQEVERLAHQQSAQSRLLKLLGVTETPAKAQEFLIRIGHWSEQHNPHPRRFGAALVAPQLDLPALADEERRDLTGLAAFAIDDEGNEDPDDAVSLDGDRIWVHVADVAALAAPDSDADLEARARGATLYLPEGAIPMLPRAATSLVGMGLQEISPALSFGFCCTGQGELADITVCPSLVRVERLSYRQATDRLADQPFAALARAAERFRARREANQAARIDLPEVTVRVRDGQVTIEPLPRLAARELVADLMLMAGEAAARFCQEREIAIPFAVQPPPDRIEQARTLAAMVAYRRCFKPSRTSVEPGAHAGLGLPIYTRATSPLRRYADLLVHQQLRAHLRGQEPLDAKTIAARAGQADVAGASVRKAERFSNQHWKLVYLNQHPGWRGQGVVVAREERRVVVLIPELALETRVRTKQELLLDAELDLILSDVDLPELEPRFRLAGG